MNKIAGGNPDKIGSPFSMKKVDETQIFAIVKEHGCFRRFSLGIALHGWEDRAGLSGDRAAVPVTSSIDSNELSPEPVSPGVRAAWRWQQLAVQR
jgi:hypothetical protein